MRVRRLWARAREVLLTEPGESDGRAAERAGAAALAEGAAELRGGVAKVAQMTAYFRGLEHVATDDAGRSLPSSWDDLPPMDRDLARAVVEEDLGAAVDELFPAWENRPLASASIGQVHADGDAVVKVQYPGIAEALRSDLSSAGLVDELAGTGTHLERTALEATRAAVLGELDYRAEADALERFATAFADDAQIRIPAVDRARSSLRVLTMERIRGARLADVVGAADHAIRGQVAATVFRFAWASALRHGVINADPNPGNYLVIRTDPPSVGFLDFGCTVDLAPEVRAGELAMCRAILHHDAFEAADRFRSNLVDRGLVRDARVLHGDAFREWERTFTAPFLARDPYSWNERYADQLAATTSRLLASGQLRLPGVYAVLWRQRLGVAAILGSLRAALPFRAMLAGMLDEIG